MDGKPTGRSDHDRRAAVYRYVLFLAVPGAGAGQPVCGRGMDAGLCDPCDAGEEMIEAVCVGVFLTVGSLVLIVLWEVWR